MSAKIDGVFERGFLPTPDPLPRLTEAYAPWEEAAVMLPHLLAAGQARNSLARLPPLDPSPLAGAELERAMQLLSFFGAASIWESWRTTPGTVVPRAVAVPWAKAAALLDRPPVLSYASHALRNWRRLDPDGPIAFGNLAVLQSFLGGLDESWFILAHVAIEAEAAPIVAAVLTAQKAVQDEDLDAVAAQLGIVADAQERVFATMLRLPEGCDPHVFFSRIQPFLHGFDEPGIVFEGVFDDRPQRLAGASAAQSAILPLLDAALGIAHADDHLRKFLVDLRRYMAREHRQLLDRVESGPSIRELIRGRGDRRHAEAYNRCIDHLATFRTKHVEISASYILHPAQRAAKNDGRAEKGTGGTPFTAYLKKHRDETTSHRL